MLAALSICSSPLPVYVNTSVCMSVPHRGLCSLLFEQHTQQEGMRDTSQKPLTEFYKGLRFWPQLTKISNGIRKPIDYEAISLWSFVICGGCSFKGHLQPLLFPASDKSQRKHPCRHTGMPLGSEAQKSGEVGMLYLRLWTLITWEIQSQLLHCSLKSRINKQAELTVGEQS